MLTINLIILVAGFTIIAFKLNSIAKQLSNSPAHTTKPNNNNSISKPSNAVCMDDDYHITQDTEELNNQRLTEVDNARR